jgi:hypothetical protein
VHRRRNVSLVRVLLLTILQTPAERSITPRLWEFLEPCSVGLSALVQIIKAALPPPGYLLGDGP